MIVQLYKCRLVKDGRALQLPGRRAVNAEGAVSVFRRLMVGCPHEEIWTLMLNGQNEIQGAARVALGGLHGCGVRVCDILRPVIVSGACSFIVSHNHPSGSAEPSAADRDMTRQLLAACRVVGVTLVDHVIVTAGPEFRSMREVTTLWAGED